MNITKYRAHAFAALVACAIIMVVGTLLYSASSDKASNREKFATYPVFTSEERRKMIQQLQTALQSGPNSSKEYFELLLIWEQLDMAEKRDLFDHPPMHPLANKIRTYDSNMVLTHMQGNIERITQKEKGTKLFEEERTKFEQHPIVQLRNKHYPWDWSRVIWWLHSMHILGMFLALLLHVLQVLENGGNPLLEVLSWRAWRRVLAWEVFGWSDPEVTLEQQLALLWRVATTMAIGGLSLAGGGIAKAFGQDKPKQEPEKDEHSLITDPSGKRFAFALEIGDSSRYDGYLVGRRFHDGHIFTTAFTVDDNRTGLFGSVWASKSLTKRTPGNFGDEWDFTAGIKRRWHGLNVKADLTAINGRPLSRWPAGDVVIPSLRVGKDFSKGRYGTEPFGQAHYSFPAGKGGPRKGWIFHFGANHTFKISECLSLSGTTSAVKHTGPFNFPSGAHANFDFGVNWRVSDHLSITAPSGKVLVPLTRSGDGQHPLANVSMGLRYAW